MSIQPTLKLIMSELCKQVDAVREKDPDALSDADHVKMFKLLLSEISRKPISKSTAHKYITDGMADDICDSICNKVSLFRKNLLNFLKMQSFDSLNSNIYNGIDSIMENQFNPYLKSEWKITKDQNKSTKLDKISRAFEICCKVYSNGTDDALILDTYQVKDNTDIIGRDAELETMRECISDSGYVILYGEDGMGKTELAKKYLALHKSEYDLIISVGYQGSIQTSISSIPDKNGACQKLGMSYDDFDRLRTDIINKVGDRAVIFIDDFTVEEHVESFNIEDFTLDYTCHFIFATSHDISQSACDKMIKVDKLDRNDLSQLLTKGLNSRDASIISSRQEDILRKLNHNTLKIELYVKAIKYNGINVSEIERLLDNSADIIDNLVNFEMLDPVCQQVLGIFAMMPRGFRLNEALAKKLFGDTFDSLKKTHYLHLLCREVTAYNEKWYYLHSLIAPVISKQGLIAKNYKEVITNLGNYAKLWSSNREPEAAIILKSICNNMNGSSDEWTIARNKIIVWFRMNGDKYTAQEIFSSNTAQKALDPDVYKSLYGCDFNDNNKLKKIIENGLRKASSSMEKLNKNREKIVKNVINQSTNYNSQDISNVSIKDRFKHDKGSLLVYINNMETLLYTNSFDIYSNTVNTVKHILYSYKSKEIFSSVPGNLDDKTVIDFLYYQTTCNTYEETNFFKTTKAIYGDKVNAIDLFGSFTNMKILLYDIIVYIYLHDVYCCENSYASSNLDSFIRSVYNDLTVETKVSWLTKLIYAKFEDTCNYPSMHETINKHSVLLSQLSPMSEAYIPACICNFFAYGVYNYFRVKNGKTDFKAFYSDFHDKCWDLYRLIVNSSDSLDHVFLLFKKYCTVLALWSSLIKNEDVKFVCSENYNRMIQFSQLMLTMSNNTTEKNRCDKMNFWFDIQFEVLTYLHIYVIYNL